MADRYLIPGPNGQWLALTADQLAQAIAEAAQIAPQSHQRAEGDDLRDVSLVTADEMPARTGVDASWFLSQARLNEIPHVRLGKYVRFDPYAVFAAYSKGPDTRFGKPSARSNSLIQQITSSPVSKGVSDSPMKRGPHAR